LAKLELDKTLRKAFGATKMFYMPVAFVPALLLPWVLIEKARQIIRGIKVIRETREHCTQIVSKKEQPSENCKETRKA
jgi:cytochrome P450